MCNKRAIEDEYHFILECDRYTDIRCKYIETYYYRNPFTFKLIQLLSLRSIKELDNIGKYLYTAEKNRKYFILLYMYAIIRHIILYCNCYNCIMLHNVKCICIVKPGK